MCIPAYAIVNVIRAEGDTFLEVQQVIIIIFSFESFLLSLKRKHVKFHYDLKLNDLQILSKIKSYIVIGLMRLL